MKTIAHKLSKEILSKLGIQVTMKKPGKPNPIHQWEDDRKFINIMKQIEGYTLVDTIRCFMIYQCVKQIIHLNGDVAEIGVYKGGTARLLSKALDSTKKKIHLFDTFAGMPPTDPIKDIVKQGEFGDTSLASVKSYLKDCNNLSFYQGFFPDTTMPIENKLFCLVHIDVDIYRSIMDCCQFFYPRLVKGGIMIFDDYGWLTCPGAKLAVDEYFLDKPESVFYLPTGQSFIFKF